MNQDLEKFLNSLPQQKLSHRADVAIQFLLEKEMAKQKLAWFSFSFHWQPAFALGMITLIIIGSTGTYAYASPSVTLGSFLYPVKRGLESTSLSIATSPQKKASLYMQFADRRLAEANHLFKITNTAVQGQRLATTLTEATKEIEHAHLIAEQSGNDSTETSLLATVKTSGQHQLEQINQLASRINFSDNNIIVVDSLANAIENLRDQDNDMNEEINDHDADNNSTTQQKLNTSTQHFIEREITKNQPEKNTAQIAKQNLKQAESQIKLIKSSINTTSNQNQKNKNEQIVKHLNKKIEQAKLSIKEEDWRSAIEQANTAVAISRNINVFLNDQKTTSTQKQNEIIEQEKNKHEYYNSDLKSPNVINDASTTSKIEPKIPQKTEQPKEKENSVDNSTSGKSIQENSKNTITEENKKSDTHSTTKDR
ncbi:MAG: DUF5667 domain-containing protein [Candidatus Falkowbacteria bacterium]